VETKPIEEAKLTRTGRAVVLCPGPSLRGREETLKGLLSRSELLTGNAWFKIPLDLKPTWVFYLDVGYYQRCANNKINEDIPHVVTKNSCEVNYCADQPYHWEDFVWRKGTGVRRLSFHSTGSHMINAAWYLGYTAIHVFGWSCSSLKGNDGDRKYYYKSDEKIKQVDLAKVEWRRNQVKTTKRLLRAISQDPRVSLRIHESSNHFYYPEFYKMFVKSGDWDECQADS
jgi:hypothetical protein